MSEVMEDLFPGMYVGEYDHVLDSQGRVSLPSEWRDKSGETELMMIPTRDQALLLFPIAVFRDFMTKIGKLGIANPNMRALAYLGSVSRRCRCDKQGRIALDKEKLAGIGVERNLKLIGAFTHIRICAPENWTLPDDPELYLDDVQQISDGGDDISALLKGVFGK